MTLPEALTFARAHQPLLRAAQARLTARERETRIPRAGWLPQVGVTAQILYGTANNTTASTLNVPEVDLPRIGATRAQTGVALSPSPSTLLAASVDQEVWDFGRLSALSEATDARRDAARADAEQVALDTTVAVEEAFDAVLAARQVQSAAAESERRSRAHLAVAEAGVKSGMRPAIEVTRARAEVADADVRRQRADGEVDVARSQLAAAIGSTEPMVDATTEAAASTGPASPGLDEALRLALDRRPEVIAALARVRASAAATRGISGEMRPNLFITAGLSGRAGGAAPTSGEVPTGCGWLPYVLNWHAGLVLQWNLFDATVLARRDAARAAEDEARARVDAARSAVIAEVERSWIELDTSTKAVPGLLEAVAAARANQAQADARFRSGLGNSVELADAEALLVGAETRLAVGRFNADRARARLSRALGASLSRGDAR